MKSRLIFALCSLIAAASAVSAQTSLDHFTCYFTQGPTLPETVQLIDEFDAVTAASTPNIQLEYLSDLTPFRFCNPVAKTVAGVNGVTTTITPTHPEAHLVMYRITTQPDTPRAVSIQNQFTGTAAVTLITGPAEYLAVPSGKALFSSAGASQPTPFVIVQGELDHFKCYAVTGAPSVNTTVTLVDEFFPLSTNTAPGVFATVLRPYLFCNPAIKITTTVTGNTTTNPLTGATAPPFFPPTNLTLTPNITQVTVLGEQDHLTCYWIASRPAIPRLTVAYDNQFVPLGTLPILPADLETLCVPTAKLAFAPIRPPA